MLKIVFVREDFEELRGELKKWKVNLISKKVSTITEISWSKLWVGEKKNAFS